MDEVTKKLLKACRRGNHMAQLTFYKQYARLLYAVCLRIIGNAEEAEEAMQDSFLKIFTRLDQYHEEQSLEAWIRSIAVHTAIDYVRRQHPEVVELTMLVAEPEPDEYDEEGIQYSVGRVKEAVLLLPTGYRMILSLYLFEGYDMEEIASILHIKPPSVRSQYLRAKKRLLEIMEKNGYG